MRIAINLFLIVLLSSCLVGKGKYNKMLGKTEEYAIMKMYRLPDETTTYKSYKVLIWIDPFRSPWVNKYRYTTLMVNRNGIVEYWMAKDEPMLLTPAAIVNLFIEKR
jgi:hypothetical protein